MSDASPKKRRKKKWTGAHQHGGRGKADSGDKKNGERKDDEGDVGKRVEEEGKKLLKISRIDERSRDREVPLEILGKKKVKSGFLASAARGGSKFLRGELNKGQKKGKQQKGNNWTGFEKEILLT